MATPPPAAPAPRRPRKNTTFEQLDRPGSVRINVTEAYIVDEDPSTPPRSGSPQRGSGQTSDIRLPHHKAEVSHIAVDIGGSLAKLVYFSREPNGEGGKLSFQTFETERIDDLLTFMKSLVNGKGGSTPRTRTRTPTPTTSLPPAGPAAKESEDVLYVMATGGGAYKFYDTLKATLGVDIYREDEMECLIIGLDFFITQIPSEVFTFPSTTPTPTPLPPPTSIYPYLLVNIGSGVSMIKVSGPSVYTRIGGSSLGGGTLWGLLSLLTQARSFDEMLGMAEKGDNTKVDMLVGDIYGGGYGRIGLKSSTIASSFGKVFKKGAVDVEEGGGGAEQGGVAGRKGFRQEDISRSLLYAVSNNIGQIAYLQAQNHGLEHIYFGGSFIRGHRQTMNTLSYAIKFWSKGEKKAYFLRHEGYLGAVGAFLRRQPRNWGRRYSTGDEMYPAKRPEGV